MKIFDSVTENYPLEDFINKLDGMIITDHRDICKDSNINLLQNAIYGKKEA